MQFFRFFFAAVIMQVSPLWDQENSSSSSSRLMSHWVYSSVQWLLSFTSSSILLQLRTSSGSLSSCKWVLTVREVIGVFGTVQTGMHLSKMWLWNYFPTVVSMLFAKYGILCDLWPFTLLKSDPVSILMGEKSDSDCQPHWFVTVIASTGYRHSQIDPMWNAPEF